MDAPASQQLDITQPPLNTSHLGVMQSASAYFDLPWSTAELFVGSGHAFITNIHGELCPSGPYVWETAPMLELFSNLNLDVEVLGFVMPHSATNEQRAEFDAAIRQALIDGKVCTLECMDHQTVCGFDEESFHLTQPWDRMADSTPPKLKYGSWEGFDSGVPLTAFAVSRNESVRDFRHEVLKPAIEFALEIWETSPASEHNELYRIGSASYPNWIEAIDEGHGTQHGAWWNAVVWGECKAMAASYFDGLASSMNEATELVTTIAANYREAADALLRASDIQQGKETQKEAVRQAESTETRAFEGLRELLPLL
ncbi:MAG: hypothetical protein OXG05_15910 [Gammaproteobacteria bacterium]|nr:hypothetical protein [Gammaproteobacteria bacterium]